MKGFDFMKKFETAILTNEDASAFIANNMSISFNGYETKPKGCIITYDGDKPIFSTSDRRVMEFECDIHETLWAVDTAEESIYFTDFREAREYYTDLVNELKEDVPDRSVFITISKIRLSFCVNIDVENMNVCKLADIFYSHVDDDVELIAETQCVNRNFKEFVYN